MPEVSAESYRSKKVKAALLQFTTKELRVIRELLYCYDGPVLLTDLKVVSISLLAVREILRKAVQLGLVTRTTKEGSGRPVAALHEYFEINGGLRAQIEASLPAEERP